MPKSPVTVLVNGLIGIALFIVAYIILDALRPFVNYESYDLVLDFFKSNLYLIASFVLLMLAGDFFGSLRFPYTIPGPLLTAGGSVFALIFVYRVTKYLDEAFEMGVYQDLAWTKMFVIPLIFVIIIVVGYINVFVKSQKSFSMRPKH
jgi:hypothetical protein